MKGLFRNFRNRRQTRRVLFIQLKIPGTFEMRAKFCRGNFTGKFPEIRKLLKFRTIKPKIPRGNQMERKFVVRNFPKCGYICYTLSSFSRILKNAFLFVNKVVGLQSGVFGWVHGKRLVTQSIYPNFQKHITEFSVAFDLQNFWLNDSHFNNFNIFGFSGSFIPFASVLKVGMESCLGYRILTIQTIDN